MNLFTSAGDEEKKKKRHLHRSFPLLRGVSTVRGENNVPDHRLDRMDRLDKAAGYIPAALEMTTAAGIERW